MSIFNLILYVFIWEKYTLYSFFRKMWKALAALKDRSWNFFPLLFTGTSQRNFTYSSTAFNVFTWNLGKKEFSFYTGLFLLLRNLHYETSGFYLVSFLHFQFLPKLHNKNFRFKNEIFFRYLQNLPNNCLFLFIYEISLINFQFASQMISDFYEMFLKEILCFYNSIIHFESFFF